MEGYLLLEMESSSSPSHPLSVKYRPDLPPVYLQRKRECGMSFLAQDARFVLLLFRRAHQVGAVLDTSVILEHFRGMRRIYDILSVMHGVGLIRKLEREEYSVYNRIPYRQKYSTGQDHLKPYYTTSLYKWVGFGDVEKFMNGQVSEIDVDAENYRISLEEAEQLGMIVRSSLVIEKVPQVTLEEVTPISDEVLTYTQAGCQCHDCIYGSYSIPISHANPSLISTPPDFLSYQHNPIQYDTPTSPGHQSSQAPTEADGYPTPSSFSTSEASEGDQIDYPGSPPPLPDAYNPNQYFEFDHPPPNKRRRVVS